MIISERVSNSRTFLEIAKETYYTNRLDALYNFAYANERFNTIKSWEQFLGFPGAEYKLDDVLIQQSCSEKLAEAQERYQYVTLSLPPAYVETSLTDINLARKYYQDENYLMCIMRASIAKSNINALTGILGISGESLPDLVDRKLGAVERLIVREQKKDVFPIMGYSYYEYAKSLEDEDIYSSLIYAEEALELGHLSLYFSEKEFSVRHFIRALDQIAVLMFLLGVSVGFMMVIFFHYRVEQPKHRKSSRKRLRKRIFR